MTAGEHRAAERRKGKIHRLVSVHHSTPSPQTCRPLPNNLISPSIIHFCFQQVILEAARERARRYGNLSSSWMEPRGCKSEEQKAVTSKSVPFQVQDLMEGVTGGETVVQANILTQLHQDYFKGMDPPVYPIKFGLKWTLTRLPKEKEENTS